MPNDNYTRLSPIPLLVFAVTQETSIVNGKADCTSSLLEVTLSAVYINKCSLNH